LGFFFGEDRCGRGIFIMDTRTGSTVFRTDRDEGHDFEFLANGKVLITRGHCEGAYESLLDPKTGELSTLGTGSGNLWNTNRTAFAVSTNAYQGAEAAIWGYNVARDFLFLSEPEQWQLDEHLIWTPDGTHLLYLHRGLTYDSDSGDYSFPSARQIVKVDAATGEQTVLTGDPRYDFHLCDNAYSGCDRWYRDWIQVRRFPFEPQQIPDSMDFWHMPKVTCLVYGIGCRQPPVLFALNWRTGELVPWEEAAIPTLTPTVYHTAGPGEG
jgi:hypothetical protein